MVATDFSDNADRALMWALSLATRHDAQLVLVHAVEPALAAVNALRRAVDDEIRRLMDQAQRTCASAGVNVKAEHKLGRPWEVIENTARTHGADLIVTGTRGRRAYKRVLLGSTADRLIRTSTIPVLVVHPTDDVPAGGLNRILVPIDFSAESLLATNMAARLLSRSGAGGAVTLLHAIELLVQWPTPDMPTVMPSYWDEAESAATRQMDSIAESLRRDGLEVKVKTFRGYPPEVIESECRGDGFDLIAMGTRGSGGVQRFMLGSVAERVLHYASCPVLTVRKHEQ